MDKHGLRTLLEEVKEGRLSPDEAVQRMRAAPFETPLGFATLDDHRALRTGQAEVIYGAGKTAAQIAAIVAAMEKNGQRDILITRLAPEAAALVAAQTTLAYHPLSRIGIVAQQAKKPLVGSIVIASAGTSDEPVCEEAALTAELFGNRVTRLSDVGVAGLHRLLAHVETLQSARVIIVVAGMEGALASVVGGLVDCPVIAVPTSVGYGASFEGLAALLAMLNACASGIGVVNIDNGYGAACLASRINQMEGLA